MQHIVFPPTLTHEVVPGYHLLEHCYYLEDLVYYNVPLDLQNAYIEYNTHNNFITDNTCPCTKCTQIWYVWYSLISTAAYLSLISMRFSKSCTSKREVAFMQSIQKFTYTKCRCQLMRSSAITRSTIYHLNK